MGSDSILGFLVFAFVAAITPGPSNILLASVGANSGVRRGLPCLCGIAAGMGLMIALVALGLGSIVHEYPILRHGLRWGGIALLLWLAWKIATAGRGEAMASRDGAGFWQGAALQWVNPKSWLVSASAVGASLPAGSPGAVPQALLLGALFVLVALPSCFVWLASGAALQRWLRTERTAKWFNIVMGLLLAGSIALFR